MNVAYHILNNTIVVTFSGKTHKVDRHSELGTKVIGLIKDQDFDELKKVIDVAANIAVKSNAKFIIEDGCIYSYGVPVHGSMAKKIMEFYENDLPFDYLVNFWNNLRLNPSKVAQDELFQFLEANEVPITPDGHFVAYKRIKSNFTDIYSGKFDNSVGSKPSVPREQVNPDRTVTCSYGLHVAAWDYVKFNYGSNNRDSDLIVEVKVNPMNVIAVPMDYSMQKMRVCEYEVLDVVEHKFTPPVLDSDKYYHEDHNIDYEDDDISDSYYEPDEIVPDDNVEDVLTPQCGMCGNPEEMCDCNKIRLGNITYSIKIADGIDPTKFVDIMTNLGAEYRKPSRVPKAFNTLGKNVLSVFRTNTANDNRFMYFALVVADINKLVVFVID